MESDENRSYEKITWNIIQLRDKMKVIDEYQTNLKHIFYKEFITDRCIIDSDSEGDVIVTLYLQELTQQDMVKIDEISENYTIMPNDSHCFILSIFSFKGVDG